MTTPPACPACGSPRAADLGPLPGLVFGRFGGRPTAAALDIDPGRLYRCPGCGLGFRHPYLSQAELTALYADLPADIWHADAPADPPLWAAARALAVRFAPVPRVLDIGCYHGGFVRGFPPGWQTAGVEPSAAARRVAAAAGVDVPAATLDDLPADRTGYGAVTVLDVIEHIRAPLEFLAAAAARMAPGGCLVVQTGAFDSLPFRTFGRHYWYSALPEHVSFFPLRWFGWAGRRLGLRVRTHRRLASAPAGAWQTVFQAGRVATYAATRELRDRGVSAGWVARLPVVGRAAGWTTVPWFTAARDHLVVVLGR